MSLQSAIDVILQNPDQSKVRSRAAAEGMVASGEAAVRDTLFFEDTRAVLDALANAKALLDISAQHAVEIVDITSEIMRRAQSFVSGETFPCTEWPSPLEVVELVRTVAEEFGSSGFLMKPDLGLRS